MKYIYLSPLDSKEDEEVKVEDEQLEQQKEEKKRLMFKSSVDQCRPVMLYMVNERKNRTVKKEEQRKHKWR